MDDQFARWYERHHPECSSHHDGSAGHNRQMEPHDMHAFSRYEGYTIRNIVVILVTDTLIVILLYIVHQLCKFM